MQKVSLLKGCMYATIFLASYFFISSCNQSQHVPLPEVFTSYPQPKMVPLEFSEPEPFEWDTAGHGFLKPTSFRLDLKELPGKPYDSTGFKPLHFAPSEIDFDFDALPSRPFDLENIPAHALEVKTEVLPLPTLSRPFRAPHPVTSSSVDLRFWQQLSDIVPASQIYRVEADSSGNLWFSAPNGIFKSNGTEITQVVRGTHTPIFCFDKKGNLWYLEFVDQRHFTLGKIDLKNKRVSKAQIDLVVHFVIGSMMTDENGLIWISGGADSAPIVVDPQEMTYRLLNAEGGFTSSRYYQTAVDSKDRIWMGSRNGIDIIDPKAKTITHFTSKNGLPSDTAVFLGKGTGGKMWVSGTLSVAVDAGAGKVINYRFPEHAGKNISRILEDKQGNIWFGTNSGIDLLNTANNTVRHIGANEQMEADFIVQLTEISDGNVIINAGSNTTGKYSVYFIAQNGKTVFPLKDAIIISSVEDARSNLWIGTEKGLFVVDSLRSTYWQIDTIHGLANNYVQSISEQNGNVIVTTNGGFNEYKASQNQWLRYSQKEGLLPNVVYSAIEDGQNARWITSVGAVHRYMENGTILHLDTRKYMSRLGDNIYQGMFDGKDKVWLAGNGSPVLLNLTNNTIQHIVNQPELEKITGKGMFLDSQNRLWITCYGELGPGLYLIGPDRHTIARFTTEEGLADNSTNSILEYDGKLLVSAGKKVNIITPPERSASKKWEVSVLKGSWDLVKKQTSFFSDAVTRRGNYLYGDEGLFMISGIEPDTSLSADYVTGIKIMGKDIHLINRNLKEFPDSASTEETAARLAAGYTDIGKYRWDSLAGPYHLPVNFSLPYDRNVLLFHFTEKNDGRLDPVEYAYLLEGQDRDWTFTTRPQTESYLNLSPGHYTFRVSSRWRSGRWNEPAEFSFTIRPPWYQTWWAYAGYALLFILAAYGVFKLQKKRVVARERQRSQIREAQLKADGENEKRRNIELISEMGKEITSSLSLKNVINTVYNHVNKLMDASVFGIGLYNKEAQRLEFPATREKGETLPGYSFDLSDTRRPACWCFNNQKEILMNDFEKEHKNYVSDMAEVAVGDFTSSVIYVPLISKGEAIGVITAQSFQKDAYNSYHLSVLQNLATYTSVALANAEAYRDLQSAQYRLVQTEKMASLGELTAGIAHEIQNPLNFVNNFSEVNIDLIDEMKDELTRGNLDEVKELAADIRSNQEKIVYHGKRADGIVKSMLQHSRASSGQKELTDINNLCDEYLRLSFHGLRAKDKSFQADFKTDFDDRVGKVDIVPQMIGRAFLNLFNNAFYAVNQKRQQLLAEDHAAAYSPQVRVKSAKTDGGIRIEVEDNGGGIPESLVKKVFQPFFTTKPTGEGTGLGLSITYDIIQSHGGQLQVDTTEGEGTKFVIDLPA